MRRGKFRGTKPGFTMIEMIVVVLVFSLLILGVMQILTSAMRGTQQGQDATDHTRLAAIIFRLLDLDLRAAIPGSMTCIDGTVKGDGVVCPRTTSERKLIFYAIIDRAVKRVCYSWHTVDSMRDEILREIGDGAAIERAEHLGTGMVDDFQVDILGSDPQRIVVRLGLLGKTKSDAFMRVFSTGILQKSAFGQWVSSH